VSAGGGGDGGGQRRETRGAETAGSQITSAPTADKRSTKSAGPLDLVREILSPDVLLGGHQKLVLNVLVMHRNNGSGACFPSYDRIARCAGVHKTTAMRAVRELRAMGVLNAQVSHGRRNQYVIHTDKLPKASGSGALLVAERYQSRRATTSGSGALPQVVAESDPNYEVTTKGTAKTPPRQKPVEVEWCFDLWSEVATECGLPTPVVGDNPATKRRRKTLRTRIKEYGEDGLRQVLTAPLRSSLLRGEKTDWKGANIDWLLQPSKFSQALEGAYDDSDKAPARTPTAPATGSQSAWGDYYDKDGKPVKWCKPWSMDDEMEHQDDPRWPDFTETVLDWQGATPPPTFDEWTGEAVQ